MITDIKGLAQEEKRLSAECRKVAETANLPKMLAQLYAARIDLGEWCEHGAKQAAQDGIGWTDWCAINAPFSQQQADKYRRVYHARTMVRADAVSLPYDLNDAVKYLPTQADSKKLAYASGGTKERDPDDWQTPAIYIEAARRVMGSIDFDPFSSDEANERVGAREIYTVEEDAANTPWPVERVATVWMNPPYGRGKVEGSVRALMEHLADLEHAIVLVNNASDTAWFRTLWENCDAFMMTYGRIQFELPGSPDKVRSSNTRGQAFFYFGPAREAFCREFGAFGGCSIRYEGCRHV